MPERRRDKIKAAFTGLSSKIGPGSTVYSGLRTSLALLEKLADASELPVLKGAVGGLLKVVEIIEKMAQNQDDVAELLEYLKCLEKIFNDAQNSKIPKPLASRIEELSQEIIKIVQEIGKMKSQSIMTKFFRSDADENTLSGHVQKINRLFAKFQFGSSVALESGMMIVTEDVAKIGHDIKRLVRDGLPRALEARFDMDNRQRCLEGTRVELLDTACRWAMQNDLETSASIFWLCGQGGTGKTTICSSVADSCSALGRLGASFFFSRDREDRTNIRLLVPTIVHQLGNFCKEFGGLVTEIFSNDPDLAHSDPLTQLEKLIINPLKDCVSFPSGTVIIMDALDECKDDNPISTLLSMVSKNRHRLTRLRFFITSRPESNIRLGFEPLREITQSLILHDIDTTVVNADLELYLRNGFSIASRIYPDLVEQGWPSNEAIVSLVNKSSKLFIFAATALRFILDESYSDPANQLTLILEQSQGVESSTSPFFYLDQMYLQVLRQGFPDFTPSSRLTLLKQVLGAIILIRNPLSPGDLESLLGLGRGVVRTILRQLHSIMVVPDTDAATIRLIHPSFFDFSTLRCPDPRFRINVSSHHEQLAVFCLEQMKSLKRDICEIKDASMLNEEVEDLPERIEQHIPPALRYSCLHWVFHLCSAGKSPLQTSVDGFCHEKLLYWIETLSLLGPGSLQDGIRHLQALQIHFTNHSFPANELLALLKDAQAFIAEYFELISSASLQLYRSVLPLSPPSNSLRKEFSHELYGSMRVLRRPGEGNYSGVIVLRGHSKWIKSAEFSPDSRLIVSTSHYPEVRLWDRGTGTLSKILRLDSPVDSEVFCKLVKFFPGGERIVSGSDKGSICIWDVRSGAHLKTIQLEGEYRKISCYACSPDVTRIVGSADSEVMIWDVPNGSLLNTLRGHKKDIYTLAFSQNHMLIASGSSDDTIRIWDAVSGVALKTLTGHSSSIFSVAFSPCSNYLLSGSSDKDLRLWDIPCGITSKKFKGHCCSVAFSLKGTQIISGHKDGELRVWNVVDGELLKTLRLGKNGDVENVGFSFDGSHYICTWDHDIYIWDADQASDLDRLEEQLLQTKFSPDGTHIIAVRESEVHLWDGLTGAPLKIIEGRSNLIGSLEISPNNQYIAFGFWFYIGLCDISSTTVLRTLRGHSLAITSVAFSSDSTQIASTSWDRTLRIWNTTSGDNIFTVLAHHRSAYFSPDGSQIIADTHQRYDIPLHIRSHPMHLNDSVVGQLQYSISGEWVFVSRGDKKERCIWLPADWRWNNAVSSHGRVAIGTRYGLVLLDLSDINLSI